MGPNQDVGVNGAHAALSRVVECPASAHRAFDALAAAVETVLDGYRSTHTEPPAEPQFSRLPRPIPGQIPGQRQDVDAPQPEPKSAPAR